MKRREEKENGRPIGPKELRKARKLSQEGMPDRYDRTERHDHLICKRCGKLLDVNLSDLTGQLQAQLDVPILAYDLKLIYICEDCRRRDEERQGNF